MNIKMKCGVAIFAMSCVVSPVAASTCGPLIPGLQAKVDKAIEGRAGSDRWKRESRDAKLDRQPTPFSLAATEGRRGMDFQVALDGHLASLDTPVPQRDHQGGTEHLVIVDDHDLAFRRPLGGGHLALTHRNVPATRTARTEVSRCRP